MDEMSIGIIIACIAAAAFLLLAIAKAFFGSGRHRRHHGHW
jgi:hypothetical protein